MRCKIADLIVEIPEAGGIAPRCRAYLHDGPEEADIVIRAEEYVDMECYRSRADMMAYMESGLLFYMRLLRFGGMMFHASAVAYEGKAYLFSGPSGVGKSTHTGLWQQNVGEKAQIINDDKPALRSMDGRWYAYGTPWSGKSGINLNVKVPLAGICFLKRGEKNRIRRLSPLEAVPLLYMQSNFYLSKKENMHLLLTYIEELAQQIPIYELENLPIPEAARLSMETMQAGAAAAGL